MPTYSLDFEGPGAPDYVPAHEFPEAMRASDTFTYGGWAWQVLEVAQKQFDRPGEPTQTLRCIPAP